MKVVLSIFLIFGGLQHFISPDNYIPFVPSFLPFTMAIIYLSGFQKIDGKYNSNIINTSSAEPGEIVFGNDISGVKGFFAKFTIKTTGVASTTNTELFAVSTNYNINSY